MTVEFCRTSVARRSGRPLSTLLAIEGLEAPTIGKLLTSSYSACPVRKTFSIVYCRAGVVGAPL